jgi:hypothetical protein
VIVALAGGQSDPVPAIHDLLKRRRTVLAKAMGASMTDLAGYELRLPILGRSKNLENHCPQADLGT